MVKKKVKFIFSCLIYFFCLTHIFFISQTFSIDHEPYDITETTPLAPSLKTAPSILKAFPETLSGSPPLYNNGPLVTHPGSGAGGADVSAGQSSLGMQTLGFSHAVSAGNRVADDFAVPSSECWSVNQIVFYAYQNSSPTSPTTFTAVNYRVWDGPPNNPTSNVVFGDTTSNRLVGSTWSNIYRAYDTDLLNTQRPIMANTVSAGFNLTQGAYWLDWQADGTLSSGPWVPSISILGQTTTGNGLQYTTSWAPALDSLTATQQGFPFIIYGINGCESKVYLPIIIK